MTESAFLQDLALVMAVAGVTSVLFTRLGWPKVIGYIIAGILVSSHTWGMSMLADESSVQTIAQLGIIFLMFTLGLEFSTSSMKAIRRVTLPTAIFDTVVMTWIGYTVGQKFLGWDTVPSLFLGAAICDSSTTLLAKIIGEMKWSARPFVKYVIGTSVCEDIICVGMIALITGVASGKGMNIVAVGESLGGLLLFFFAAIVFGLILIPRLLKSVARRGDDETLLLTALGFCFFVTYIAYRLEFSLALGAFIVGIIGASSVVRSRLHRLADPLRSMFAAVFFVSIGLLVDISACRRHLPTIIALSAVVMGGKLVNCFAGAIVSGERLKTAVQMGFGLAQIGEFAYLVALLYLTLTGDPSSPMYQIVVGVSLLTTVMNPLMLRASDPIGTWLEAKCPRRIARLLDIYRATLERFRASCDVGENRRIVRSGLIELGVIAILELAVAFSFSILNERDWSAYSEFFDGHKRLVFFILNNLFSLVMFVPVVVVSGRIGTAVAGILIGGSKARWMQSLVGVVRLAVSAMAVGLFFMEMVMFNVNLLPKGDRWMHLVLLAAFTVAAVFGWRFLLAAGKRATSRLSEALAADGRRGEIEELESFTIPSSSVRRMEIAAGSSAIGGTVVSLSIRARTGASVVSVERDGEVTGNPGPDWTFAEGDVVVAMGGAGELSALSALLGCVS